MNNSCHGSVLVALSGGVDSAVSAALLKDQGYDVSGVYVRTWEHENDLLGECPGAKDLKDARAVAEIIGIPFSVVNFIDFYQNQVVMPMVTGYEQGITPNPDILCNRAMKFGALLDYAEENGFSALATGHYCKRKKSLFNNAAVNVHILLFRKNKSIFMNLYNGQGQYRRKCPILPLSPPRAEYRRFRIPH